MIYILINISTIAIATLAGLGAGTAFYFAFDRVGMSQRHKGPKNVWKFAILAFVTQFWLASILAGALILAPAEANALTMALGSAVVIWIGFVAPVLVMTHFYRGIPLRAAALDCSHWLIVMVVQAAVLFAIGLFPPPA